MISQFRLKKGEMVEIAANTTTYRGLLLEVTDDEVYIKGSTRTWAIALGSVRSIRYVHLVKDRPKEGAITDGFLVKTDPFGKNPDKD